MLLFTLYKYWARERKLKKQVADMIINYLETAETTEQWSYADKMIPQYRKIFSNDKNFVAMESLSYKTRKRIFNIERKNCAL